MRWRPFLCCLLVVLGLRRAVHGSRALSQFSTRSNVSPTASSRRVDSVESFKAALIDNVQHIIFTANITLSSDVLPEVPATCLAKAPLKVCQPNVVIYGNSTDDWPVDTSALWESETNTKAWIDFRWLRANLILTRPVVLNNLALVQMWDDHIPYAFSFATVDNGAILIQDCDIWSPCGDRTPRYVLEVLLTVLDINAQYSVWDDRNALQFFDSKLFHLYDSVNAGNIQIVESFVQCYNDSVYKFAPEEVPKTWLPNSDTVTLRQPPDSCQRQLTAGADYRGNVSTTREGYKCQRWSSQVPENHTRTVANYPYSGLGDHNYCRNPDNTPEGVWCYVDSKERLAPRWSYCDVPFCDEIEPWETLPANTTSKGDLFVPKLAGGLISGVVFVILVLVGFVCYKRRKTAKATEAQSAPPNGATRRLTDDKAHVTTRPSHEQNPPQTEQVRSIKIEADDASMEGDKDDFACTDHRMVGVASSFQESPTGSSIRLQDSCAPPEHVLSVSTNASH